MKETFCCVCGKPGKWPVCSSCEKKKVKKKTKEKKEKISLEHHSEYFEAIIQNRADVDKEQIWKAISKIQATRKFNAWEKKNDFYFSDVKVAKIVARKLSKTFNLEIKESRKQIGYDRHKSKKRYKWNICLRNRD
jgi:NMD protein affecting ribosome stability and mRNA decay